ncbi:MAG: FlxA-like family protein, partial [Candidatus Gastranaerophilales bacterium]|nr:FlxA-like family protein [Candidatus Gastranaerophilales bacterium]
MTTITNSPNSVLVDNQNKKRVAYTFGQLSSNQGIDFSHDALIVAAKSKVSESEATEQFKASAQDFAKIDEEHIQQEYQSLLAQQQSQLLLRQMAQGSADNLATQQESIFQQLLRSNSTVADLENKKTESESKIANYTNTISNLKLEKAGIVAEHDRNISNYEETIRQNNNQINSLNNRNASLRNQNSTLETQNSTLDTQISNLQGQISELSAQITEDMPEEQKAQIQQQISSLENQIKECNDRKAENKRQQDANNIEIE